MAQQENQQREGGHMINFQRSHSHRDMVDSGHERIYLHEGSASQTAAFDRRIFVEENLMQTQASVLDAAEERFHDIGQQELSEMIESEIDSPVRELEQQKKEVIRVKNEAQSRANKKKQNQRSSKTREGSKRREQPQREKTLQRANSSSSMFDYSSDDDMEMQPAAAFDFQEPEEMDPFAMETNEAMISSIEPSTSAQYSMTTRSGRARKSTRQQSKTVSDYQTTTSTPKKGAGRKNKKA